MSDSTPPSVLFCAHCLQTRRRARKAPRQSSGQLRSLETQPSTAVHLAAGVRFVYLAADPVPAPKGAAVRIERTVRTMTSLGHTVALLTLAGPDDDLLRIDGVEHETVHLAQPSFLDRQLELRARATSWLERQRGDVVQVRSIWEGLPAVEWATRRGARLVWEVHGAPSVELPAHFPRLHQSPETLGKLIHEENQLLRAAHLLLTHSHTGWRYLLQRGADPRRIAIVPNAVDPELFSPASAPLTGDIPFRLAYTGTLAPWQGLGTLIEALAGLRHEPLELDIVGPRKSTWRRQLRALARRAPRPPHDPPVRAHRSGEPGAGAAPGPRLRRSTPDDPRNALQGCCPIKLLEYMAVGRPVVATAIAPILELLDERSALLVSPGSPMAISDGLHWLRSHTNEREAMGHAARDVALARFTPEHFRSRLAQALELLDSC